MQNAKNIKLLGIIISVGLLFFVLTGLFGLNNQLELNLVSKFWLSRFEIWGERNINGVK